jgi:beta-galactosidase
VRETTGREQPMPYLVTEFGGHMYPTKSYDQEQRQA